MAFHLNPLNQLLMHRRALSYMSDQFSGTGGLYLRHRRAVSGPFQKGLMYRSPDGDKNRCFFLPLPLQQCSSPCILLSIQLEIKNNIHEIKQSPQQLHIALDKINCSTFSGFKEGVTMLLATLNTCSLFEIAAGTAKTTLAK